GAGYALSHDRDRRIHPWRSDRLEARGESRGQPRRQAAICRRTCPGAWRPGNVPDHSSQPVGLMFRPFLDSLRRHGVPASLREYLDLLGGLQARLTDWSPEGFYHLARATLVKNEAHIDRFDRAFAEAFAGLDQI